MFVNVFFFAGKITKSYIKIKWNIMIIYLRIWYRNCEKWRNTHPGFSPDFLEQLLSRSHSPDLLIWAHTPGLYHIHTPLYNQDSLIQDAKSCYRFISWWFKAFGCCAQYLIVIVFLVLSSQSMFMKRSMARSAPYHFMCGCVACCMRWYFYCYRNTKKRFD